MSYDTGFTDEQIAEMAVEYAAAGAHLMDMIQPSWFIAIAKHVLDMNSCDMCILGQLYSDYEYHSAGLGMSHAVAEKFGFIAPWDLDYEDGEVYYPILTAEWLKHINTRLNNSGRA